MGIITSSLLSSIITSPISILINLLSSKIEGSKICNQPTTKQLWKKFFIAFYDSFELISQNKLARYTPNQIEISREVRKEIKIYIQDSNYLPFLQILQDHSNENFDNFLYKLRIDHSDHFKKIIADSLYKELQLKKRIPQHDRKVVLDTLIDAFREYYDAFLSTLSSSNQQRIIIEEIYTSRQSINDFTKVCQNALASIIENSPDHLTLEIFKNLSNENLFRYYKQEVNYVNFLIERQEELSLFKDISGFTKSIFFLIGSSGTGKSIICLKVLNFLKRDNNVLWINARNIEKSGTLEQAIHYQLQEIKSDLRINYSDLFKILSDRKLYIVVDDVNRNSDSTALMNKLVSWRSDAETPQYFIICPVWEKNYQSFVSRYSQAETRSKKLSLSFFSRLDAIKLIEKALSINSLKSTYEEIAQVAKNLNYDPFLIGLFIDLVASNKNNILSLSKTPLQQFFQKHINEIAQNTDILEYEIRLCLNKLGTQILSRKILNFEWSDLLIWFEQDISNQKILRKIGKQGSIFKIHDDNGFIQFRHDRIRDKLLVDQLITRIEKDEIEENVLREIYFDELLSQAITQYQASSTMLDFFYKNNPSVLFESIKYLSVCEESYQHRIIKLVKQWLEKDPRYEYIKDSINQILDFMNEFRKKVVHQFSIQPYRKLIFE